MLLLHTLKRGVVSACIDLCPRDGAQSFFCLMCMQIMRVRAMEWLSKRIKKNNET